MTARNKGERLFEIRAEKLVLISLQNLKMKTSEI